MTFLKKIFEKLRQGYLKEIYEETRWMYQYARRYWKSIIFYILAGIFGTCMGLWSGILSKDLIDVVTGAQKGHIGLLAGLMVSVAVGKIVSSAIISRISARINVMVQNEIQADIYNKVIYSDWESLHEFRSGDLLNRLTSDASQVASSVIGWIPAFITKLCQFSGAFGVIFYYDSTMAFIALLSAPVTILVSRYLVKRMRAYNKEIREMTSDLMAFQDDSFQNLQTVKAFGLMALFGQKLREMQQHYKEKMLDYNKFSIYTSSFMSATGMIVSYICFGWSVYRLWTGYITTGTMLMFLQMANSLSSSFSSLIQVVPSAINAATCAGRLMAVSELKKEPVLDQPSVKKLQKEKEQGISVDLRQIDVTYKEGNQVISKGDFHAQKGQIVALVGPSGEGKTTLIRILLGLIYPASGETELTGQNGITCRISSATRDFFGYVPQGNTIFAGTIAENMRMVKCDATEEEINRALEIACARDFVSQLPDGINTKIGERGTGLSEGQAQRLSIARAVLRDAPILLLDEATSALDIETEEKVLKNIMAHGKNKTCIVTTHRPSVLSISDHIYKIKENHLEKIK